MTTSHLLQRLVSAHLGTTTRRSVAVFLGLADGSWGRYLAGDRSPTEATVNAWLATCRAQGMPLPLTVADGLEAWSA